MSYPKFRRLGSALALAAATILPAAAQQIGEPVKQQIADILRAKRSFTPTQRKLSSHLITASMKARHQSLGSIPFSSMKGVDTDPAGLVVVDVKARSLAAAAKRVNAVGGTVLYKSENSGRIRARVPLMSLETIAASDSVSHIATPARARTNSIRNETSAFESPTAPLQELVEQRREILKRNLQVSLPLVAANGRYPALGSLLRPLHMAPFIGAVTSQGYITHTANQAVAAGYDGTGVRIGVLSDSASPARVAALIASGDLPPDVTVVPGQEGDGEDEGTAMMEIVHDMAPGAKIFFATAFNGEDSFADNIRTLRFTYGCDIIVDDVTYFDEGAFQDSTVALAVNDVSADGVLYFSSAGNSGDLTNHISGTWEGDFSPGGDAGTLIDTGEGTAVQALNFGTADSPLAFDRLTGSSTFIGLQWADPLGASANDYDLFVLNSNGTQVIGYSIGTQSGTQDPFEFVEPISPATSFPVGSRLVVVLFNGLPRAIHVDTERGVLAVGTAGATFGHNAGLNTVSMAATAWNSAHRGIKVFNSANPTENFSSDGPRKIFFNPDGSAITPDNYLFSTDGGQTLQKPDLTAADGVYCKTPGFLPFFGTSAAAPHGAAIAALVKSANPALTGAQIKQIMMDTAIDIMAPGTDRDAGYGITMALPAVQAALGQ